ncbi:unnamed protein product [Amoebophrya sp. A25]|nr:unnamed protein product [Amoebophrya sp. A25]|eukprot:GSA25T00024517001.1
MVNLEVPGCVQTTDGRLFALLVSPASIPKEIRKLERFTQRWRGMHIDEADASRRNHYNRLHSLQRLKRERKDWKETGDSEHVEDEASTRSKGDITGLRLPIQNHSHVVTGEREGERPVYHVTLGWSSPYKAKDAGLLAQRAWDLRRRIRDVSQGYLQGHKRLSSDESGYDQGSDRLSPVESVTRDFALSQCYSHADKAKGVALPQGDKHVDKEALSGGPAQDYKCVFEAKDYMVFESTITEDSKPEDSPSMPPSASTSPYTATSTHSMNSIRVTLFKQSVMLCGARFQEFWY